jgi:hypothetical protein
MKSTRNQQGLRGALQVRINGKSEMQYPGYMVSVGGQVRPQRLRVQIQNVIDQGKRGEGGHDGPVRLSLWQAYPLFFC